MDVLDLLLTHPAATTVLIVTGAACWLAIGASALGAAIHALGRAVRATRSHGARPVQDVHLPGDAPGTRAYAHQASRREDEL